MIWEKSPTSVDDLRSSKIHARAENTRRGFEVDLRGSLKTHAFRADRTKIIGHERAL